jgi:hypothetical protein
VARAKRTDRDRADARRRYRAATAADPETADAGTGDEAGAAEPSASPTTSSAQGARTATRAAGPRAGNQPPAPRMGILAAARAAYRPVHVRQDLRSLPALVLHRAVWLPMLLAVASLVGAVITGPANQIVWFAFTVFTLPPAMAGVFIAGFFAPTAAYLAGGLIGLVSAILSVVYVMAAQSGSVPGDAALTSGSVTDLVVYAFGIGIGYGIVLGAAAAWYKRFLAFTSPQRPPTRPASKAENSRRGSSRPASRR